MPKVKCEICGLKTSRVDNKKRTFMAQFPKDEDRCRQWVKVIGKEDLAYVPIEKLHQLKHVCGNHFRPKDFKKKKTQLRRNAVPCVGITAKPLRDEVLSQFPFHIAKTSKDQHKQLVAELSASHCSNDLSTHIGEEHSYCASGSRTSEVKQEEDPLRLEDDNHSYSDGEDADPVDAIQEDSTIVEEVDLEPELRVCRGCLNVSGLLVPLEDVLMRMYSSITEVEISEHDGYPQYLCMECAASLRKCHAFARRAERAYQVLEEIMDEHGKISLHQVKQVDRAQKKLECQLEFSIKSQNVKCFSVSKTPLLEASFVIEDMSEVKNKYYGKRDYIHVNHCIDIPPDTDNEAIETNDEELKAEDATNTEEADIDTVEYLDNDAGIDNETNIDNTNKENETAQNAPEIVPEDLDMTDIFKGLEESVSEADFGDNLKENVNDLMFRSKLKKKKPKVVKDVNKVEVSKVTIIVTLRQFSEELANAGIRILNLEEQKSALELRKCGKMYKTALYRCSMCGIRFHDLKSLTLHMESHHSPANLKYKCVVCIRTFETEELLNFHRYTEHLYEYDCSRCHKKLPSLGNFRNHMKSHKQEIDLESGDHLLRCRANFDLIPLDNNRKDGQPCYPLRYKCRCGAGFNDEDTFNRHLKRHDPEFPGDPCPDCGARFPGTTMTSHREMWHTWRFVCRQCGDRSSTDINMARNHWSLHPFCKKVTPAGLLPCAVCNKEFNTKASLLQHKHSHYSEYHTESCPECGAAFRKRSRLMWHQLTAHKYISLPQSGSGPWSCSHCDVQFRSEQALHTHYVSARLPAAEAVPFTCLKCWKIFDDESTYEMHRSLCSHGVTYPRKCSHCDLVVKGRKAHERHAAGVHPTLVYRHTKLCELCGKTMSVTGFWAHRRVCEGDACRVCGVRVSTARAATHGLRHAHRPHACALCPCRYATQQRCKTHILKCHGNALAGRLRLSLRPRRSLGPRLVVYPHSRLDVSALPPELLNKTNLHLRDYNEKFLGEIVKEEDRNKFLTHEPLDPEAIRAEWRAIRERRRKVVKQVHVGLTPAKRIDVFSKDRPVIEMKRGRKRKRTEMDTVLEVYYSKTEEKKTRDIPIETQREKDMAVRALLNRHEEEMKVKGDEGLGEIFEEKKMDVDQMIDGDASAREIGNEVDIQADNEETEMEEISCEVINIDGEEYVSIDDVLYRVQREENDV